MALSSDGDATNAFDPAGLGLRVLGFGVLG